MSTHQGWECARCHQCYAPTVKKCKGCKPVATAPAPVYPWPTYPYWYPYTYPVYPKWGPIEITCTSTNNPAGVTYTVFNSQDTTQHTLTG